MPAAAPTPPSSSASSSSSVAAPAPAPAPAPAAVPAPARRTSAAGVAAMLGSGLSNQIGAATGSLAFPVLGPVGVVAVRQYVAAVVLCAVGRPRLRSFTRHQWWPVLLLGVVFGTMNLCLYTAIDRIGLGLAVTLEFLGPLTIALAAARRRVDACCALLALAGVVVLMRPQPLADYAGMGFGLLGAASWAAYILLNRTIGTRIPGAQGAAAAALVSALAFVPIGALTMAHHRPTPATLGYAVAAGVLSSAVPYLVDLLTLRQVPAAAFGLFMSVNPVLAAFVGWTGLGQRLGWADAAAIGAVVTANAVSILSSSRARTTAGAVTAPVAPAAPAGPVGPVG
ncbi:EamA family transporter [Streptomyces sp. NPDC090025]|uniref:EamA family transporter n=1 Tax=Streptomyces sp. NPDC090025 TaxID=3365922 RepID=UPI003838902C